MEIGHMIQGEPIRLLLETLEWYEKDFLWLCYHVAWQNACSHSVLCSQQCKNNQLTFVESLLCARHCPKLLPSI